MKFAQIIVAVMLSATSVSAQSTHLLTGNAHSNYDDGFTLGAGLAVGRVIANSYDSHSDNGNVDEMLNHGSTVFSLIAGYRFTHRFGLFTGFETQTLKFTYHNNTSGSGGDYVKDFRVMSFQIPLYARFAFGKSDKVGASLATGFKLCFQKTDLDFGSGYDAVSHLNAAIFLSPALEIPVIPGLHISTGPVAQVRTSTLIGNDSILGDMADITWKVYALYDF